MFSGGGVVLSGQGGVGGLISMVEGWVSALWGVGAIV